MDFIGEKCVACGEIFKDGVRLAAPQSLLQGSEQMREFRAPRH